MAAWRHGAHASAHTTADSDGRADIEYADAAADSSDPHARAAHHDEPSSTASMMPAESSMVWAHPRAPQPRRTFRQVSSASGFRKREPARHTFARQHACRLHTMPRMCATPTTAPPEARHAFGPSMLTPRSPMHTRQTECLDGASRLGQGPRGHRSYDITPR